MKAGSKLGNFGVDIMIYEQKYDPTLELQVLQAISLRESVIETLNEQALLVREDRPFCIGVVLDAAFKLRKLSLRCIEEVVKWREVLTRPVEFKAGRKNYLLKMLQDTGDAFRVIPFSRLYRMELGGENPFMLPYRTKRQEVAEHGSQRQGPKIRKDSAYCIPELLQSLANPSDQDLRLIEWGQLYLEEEERRYGPRDLFQSGWGYKRWQEDPWRPTSSMLRAVQQHRVEELAHDHVAQGRGSLKGEEEAQEREKSTAKQQNADQATASTLATLKALGGYEERFGKKFAEKALNIPTTARLMSTTAKKQIMMK